MNEKEIMKLGYKSMLFGFYAGVFAIIAIGWLAGFY